MKANKEMVELAKVVRKMSCSNMCIGISCADCVLRDHDEMCCLLVKLDTHIRKNVRGTEVDYIGEIRDIYK